MGSRKTSGLSDDDRTVVREVLGLINFSSGNVKPDFYAKINRLFVHPDVAEGDVGVPTANLTEGANGKQGPTTLEDWAVVGPTSRLKDLLLAELAVAKGSSPAFSDCSQAEAVLELALGKLPAAYRRHHADLLFHLSAAEFEQPFLVAAFVDAILSQGGPWDETDRILGGALSHLNDFVGYRPVAVLENGRRMELYPHERSRPFPLYITGAGVAHGRYHDLIENTITFLKQAPADLLHEAHFELSQLEELALDVRSHDHSHPVNKRTNYMFGEWDPHRIDVKGRYRRFIVRRIILDALIEWVEDDKSKTPREERLFDAAAALSGTMLMASSVSGSGPEMHDSNITLTSLLPIIARRRDEFYSRLMNLVDGTRQKRLKKEEKRTQQPFGHVRQFLNMHLAGYGARQVQHRELSNLFARMGYVEASRRQAVAIPAAAIRFECAIQCRVGTAVRELDHGRLAEAMPSILELRPLVMRGIDCGAIVDPWNVLGFQGQFPLFSSREDSIPDNRIDMLIELLEDTFNVYSRALGEASVRGESVAREQIYAEFQQLADWWDKFGTTTVEDIPELKGHDACESAVKVAEALAEWRQAGSAAGDISFWRNHVEQFQSAHAYGLVVATLLKKGDHVAAMALLMQWLGRIDDAGVEATRHSLFAMLIQWMKFVLYSPQGPQGADRLKVLRRIFDHLEANAEGYWSAPEFGASIDRALAVDTENPFGGPPGSPNPDGDPDDEDNVFGAAYDNLSYKDSTDDGNWGDTLENDFGFRNTEFELLNRDMEPRLKFLNAVGQMWQMAATAIVGSGSSEPTAPALTPVSPPIPQPVAITPRQQSLFPEAPAGDPEPVADEPSDEISPEVEVAAPIPLQIHLTPDWVETVATWRKQSQQWQTGLAHLMDSVWNHEIEEPTGDHDDNVEYDIQLQVKFYLLHQIVVTMICLRNAERLLASCLPDPAVQHEPSESDETRIAQVYRAVARRNPQEVRRLLPDLVRWMEQHPLLYVPLENGGKPGSVLRAQTMQSTVRFLLRELPRLGLLRETFHVLSSAFRMERKWRPEGQAITEFDRLFDISLRNSLTALIDASKTWDSGRFATDRLIDCVAELIDHYQGLWLTHSKTMRISSVDGLRSDEDWEDLAKFIKRYGNELFHASQLTLGNVRAILHNGVDWYLDYLEENEDPLKPMQLLEDVVHGRIDREQAEWCLEQVYQIVVDKFDRFLEYNTTTTQSDYGEMFFSLLEFLRLEAAYDRDAWHMQPLTLVHEVLARGGQLEAAEVWETTYEARTTDLAARHLADLKDLQKRHGMRMPTIADHLNQRFVKPLAVNRMLALVKPAVADSAAGRPSTIFETLEEEIVDYLLDSWGSGIDIPNWLKLLEREVYDATDPEEGGRPSTEADIELPAVVMQHREFQDQIRHWKKPLISRTPGTTKRPGKPRGKKRRDP